MIYGIDAQEIIAPPAGPSIPMVRFDQTGGTVALSVASQTASNSSLLTLSSFFRVAENDSGYNSFFAFGPYSTFNKTTLAIGYNSTGDIGGHAGTTTGDIDFGTAASLVDNNIHHILMAADTNHAASGKLLRIWLDGAEQTLDYLDDFDSAFSILVNGEEFAVPDELGILGDGFTITDFQDLWIGLGQYVTDPTLFRNIDGTRASLGTNGETPTGTSPTYFFTGDAAAFSTNMGTGDAVTLTGSLTDV